MSINATGLSSPRNGLPDWKPYRWRGQPMPAPEPIERPTTSWMPGSRQERLEALARMRLNDKSLRLDRLPHDVLTHEQAAQMLGVSVRTVHRDLQVLRQKEAAQ